MIEVAAATWRVSKRCGKEMPWANNADLLEDIDETLPVFHFSKFPLNNWASENTAGQQETERERGRKKLLARVAARRGNDDSLRYMSVTCDVSHFCKFPLNDMARSNTGNQQ